MAINYLNSISLNKNELQQAVIENQPNDASAGASPVEGQLYFDTINHKLKQYNGTSWEEVGGGVKTLTTTDGTYINLTPNSATAGAVTVTADLSAADGTASAASRFLTKDNTWATVPQGDITALTEGTYINIDNPGGPIPTINHDATTRTDTTSTDAPAYGGTFEAVTGVTTNATGHITAIDVSTVTIPASDNTNTTYTLPTSAGDTNTAIVSLTAGGSGGGGGSVTFAGTEDEIAITETTGANGTVKIGLPDDVIITQTLEVGDSLTVVGDSQFDGSAFDISASTAIAMGSNKITQVADPTAAQDAATKAYVDAATVGGLVYQGGYNAATNTPILDRYRGTSIAVEKGWTYTVTADGVFYGEAVRVGDVLVAEVDLAAGTGHSQNWTTVQNNIDLANATQIGIGNVAAATDPSLTGVDVDYPTGSPGTAVVGFDITNMSPLSSSIAPDTALMAVYDTLASSNLKLNLVQLGLLINKSLSFSNTGPAVAGTSYTINAATHGLGYNSSNIMVQLVEVSSGETVYTDVTRGASGLITITFATSQAVNSFKALLQKIG